MAHRIEAKERIGHHVISSPSIKKFRPMVFKFMKYEDIE